MLTLWSYQPPGSFPLPRPRWLLTPLRGVPRGRDSSASCLPPSRPTAPAQGGEATSLPAASPMLCQWEPGGDRGSWGVDSGVSLLGRGRLPSSRWEPMGRGFCDAVQEEVPRGQLVLPGRETQPCPRTGGKGTCVVGCPCQGHSLRKTGPGDRE